MRPRRYDLLDEIGCGATGRVHLARDRRLRRYVAVKVLHPGHGPPGPAVDHPHVLGHEVHDRLVVMPLVRGGSLLDLCAQEGRLPEAYVAVLLGQLLQALEAVHDAGVVHRDVKPANLLLEATGAGRPHLRLADFGDETTVGTAGYLAPEREAGAAADPAQDVHAAGVVVRRLLDRPGPLVTLADSMTRAEPERRPGATEALARLRELPVPRAGRWPVVPDRLGPLLDRR
jgi:serine/threonine-protein kinase